MKARVEPKPRDATEGVLVPVELAAAITKFTARDILGLAGLAGPRRRIPLVRHRWRGGALHVHLGDVCDLSDLATPIPPEPTGEEDLP